MNLVRPILPSARLVPALALAVALAAAVSVAVSPSLADEARASDSGQADVQPGDERPAATVGSLWAEALAAHKAGDPAAMLAHLERAERMAPGLPALLYGIACARALGGDGDGALDMLERLAGMEIGYPVAEDEDLVSLRSSGRFAAVVERMASLDRRVGDARVAFRVDVPQFLPEGLARDPRDGSFFLGSVHRREILRLREGRPPQPFAGRDDGLMAVLGMAVDAERRALWVASAPLPQMQGLGADAGLVTALFRLDLAGGKPPRRFVPPGTPGALNDVAVGPDGTVWASDALTGAIYELPAGGDALELLAAPGSFRSPGGLALSADGARLYVADWSRGLFALPCDGGAPRRLDAPATVALTGLDGLAARGDGLIAVQNGIRPHRVVRLDLDRSGLRVRSATILEMNHPEHREPTLGVVAGSRFYYVANSQWERFTDDGRVVDPDTLAGPVVLALDLD